MKRFSIQLLVEEILQPHQIDIKDNTTIAQNNNNIKEQKQHEQKPSKQD